MEHQWRIEQREYERHEQRRGRRHAYERLNPETTALVVVDMVPFFIEQNPYTAAIVPRIEQLASDIRGVSGTVAWIVPANSPPSQAAVDFYGERVAEAYAASGGVVPIRERLCADFTIETSDVVVEKSTASALFPGGCDLHDQLQRRSIENVLIAGTVANVCCESTARDASTLGYRMVMVADANAARRDQDLNATLHTIYRSFGDVRRADEIVALLRTWRGVSEWA